MKTQSISKTIHLMLIAFLLSGLLWSGLTIRPVSAGAPVQTGFPTPNSAVRASAIYGNTLYIGGSFSNLGSASGNFALLDNAGMAEAILPSVEGVSVNTVVPDGSGGWYIGGSFVGVGGHTRNNIAHILPDLSLDFAWNPNPSAIVQSIVLSSDGSTIYVGGAFTTIGGQSRSRIAALSAETGLPTSWNPNANNTVNELLISPDGNTIYAGGAFTTIGGQTRNRIAALDAGTGLATSWNPSSTGTVEVLLQSSDGSTIYAGGSFSSIGGQSRSYLAALDSGTGLASAWNPSANGPINSLAFSQDEGLIYAGGSFTNIGGQPRNYLAALNTSTGTATTWNPSPNTSSIYALDVSTDGSTIYVGGNFSSIGGQSRNYLAALDATSGLATIWNPGPGNSVLAVALSGNLVAVGGNFTTLSSQIRNSIAAIDLTTGSVTAWNPSANGTIETLVVSSDGNTVYVGGGFTNIGGQARNRIAALDAATGLATSWNPNASTAGSTVLSLAISPDGSKIYAGGDFTTIGGQARNRIAALDSSTGLPTAWNPNASATVRSLALNSDGSKIYVGGDFTTIGGQTRNRIAALDAATAAADTWDPNASSTIYKLLVSADGSTVYAGGSFTSIGGQIRNRIAALNVSDGLATAWNPNSNTTVYSLAINGAGSILYAGGAFTSIGGKTRNRVAALDTSTGLANNWNPNAGNMVYSLAVSADGNTVFIGGTFNYLINSPNGSLAVVRTNPMNCQSNGSSGIWQLSNWSNCDNAIPGDGDSISIQAGHIITAYGSLALNNMTVDSSGAFHMPLGTSMSIAGTMTNNGELSQVRAVQSAIATTFLNFKDPTTSADRYIGVTITASGDMGNTLVSIKGNQTACTKNAGDGLITRCFTITPAVVQNATLRLYYTNAELNGQTYNALALWHWAAPWEQVGDTYTYSASCSLDQQDCWAQALNVSSYSPFGLGSGAKPTVLALQSFNSEPAGQGLIWPALAVVFMAGLWGIVRRILKGF